MIFDAKRYSYNTYLNDNMYRDQNGYLVCLNSVMGRSGIQRYGAKELNLIKQKGIIDVHRKEEDVFDEDSLASLEGRPLTLGHVKEKNGVNIKNHFKYAKGEAFNIRREDNNIVGDIRIFDEKTANDVENGKIRELSLGYTQTLKYDEENDEYSFTNIVYNHLALVEKGRAGNAMIMDEERLDLEEMENENQVVVEDTKQGKQEDSVQKQQNMNDELNDETIRDLIYKNLNANGYIVSVFSSVENPYFIHKEYEKEKHYKYNFKIEDNNVVIDYNSKVEVEFKWENVNQNVNDQQTIVEENKEKTKNALEYKEENVSNTINDSVVVEDKNQINQKEEGEEKTMIKDTAYFLEKQKEIASMEDGEMKSMLSRALAKEMEEVLGKNEPTKKPDIVVLDEDKNNETQQYIEDEEELQSYLDQFDPNLYGSQTEYEKKVRELCIDKPLSKMARQEKAFRK